MIYFSHNKQEYHPSKKEKLKWTSNKIRLFKRLLKKLSALRATLKNDERKVLDQLVTGSANEVGAHQLNVNAANLGNNAMQRPAPR